MFNILFKSECDDWIRTAGLMLCELTGEPYPDGSVRQTSDLSMKTTSPTNLSVSYFLSSLINPYPARPGYIRV